MYKFYVERIEGGIVTLEAHDGASMSYREAGFPFKLEEGMVLNFTDDGEFVIDHQAYDDRKEKMLRLQSKLKKKEKN